MKRYEKLLLAIDLAHDNHEVIERGRDLGKELAAALTLVYVIEPLPPDIVAGPYPLGVPSMAGDPEIEQERLDNARNALSAYADSHDVRGAEFVVRIGATTDVILDVAASQSIDLVLVGSHGRRGLSRLLGSTASAIVHQASCDVLTVRVTH